LKIPEEISLICASCPGKSSKTDSIISGKDGTRIYGSISPCEAYPATINQILFGKLSILEGPVNKFPKNENIHAVIITDLFYIPLGIF
jgi:hypothetical protein